MLHTTRASRSGFFCAAVISLVHPCHAQIHTPCPAEVRSYNSSGLLGFFGLNITAELNSETSDVRIDNDGYLYESTDLSPSPPANWAYALTVSGFGDSSDDDSLPTVLTTLLATGPQNSTTNITASSPSSSSSTPPVLGVACGIAILDLPFRTTRLGQTDDGTCTATLPHGCAKKILHKIATQSMSWPAGDIDLPGLCSMYATALEVALNQNSHTDNNLPGQCTKLFLGEVDEEEDNRHDDPQTVGRFVSKVEGFALTSSNQTAPLNAEMPYQCDHLDVVDQTLGANYLTSYPIYNNTLVLQDTSDTSKFNREYNDALWQVMPVITLMIRRSSNHGIEEKVDLLSAHLGCLRTTASVGNSYIGPRPEPLQIGRGGLSGGAIAGIVVAVVVGIAVIAGVAWWQVRSKQKLAVVGRNLRALKRGDKYEMMNQ
jgi:hypothetical protein